MFGLFEELYNEPSDSSDSDSNSDSDSDFNSDSDKTPKNSCAYSIRGGEKYIKKLLKSQVQVKLKRAYRVKVIASCKFCKKEFDVLESETGDCYYKECLNYCCDECTLIMKCTKCNK